MKETLIIAGFGGQGVLSMGKILAYSGVMQDFEVTWMPSLRSCAEVNVTVILSDTANVTAIILRWTKAKVRPGGISSPASLTPVRRYGRSS